MGAEELNVFRQLVSREDLLFLDYHGANPADTQGVAGLLYSPWMELVFGMSGDMLSMAAVSTFVEEVPLSRLVWKPDGAGLAVASSLTAFVLPLDVIEEFRELCGADDDSPEVAGAILFDLCLDPAQGVRCAVVFLDGEGNRMSSPHWLKRVAIDVDDAKRLRTMMASVAGMSFVPQTDQADQTITIPVGETVLNPAGMSRVIGAWSRALMVRTDDVSAVVSRSMPGMGLALGLKAATHWNARDYAVGVAMLLKEVR